MGRKLLYTSHRITVKPKLASGGAFLQEKAIKILQISPVAFKHFALYGDYKPALFINVKFAESIGEMTDP